MVPAGPDEAYARMRGPDGVGTTIRVYPGGHYVSDDCSDTIVTVLGSCIAACIRDPMARVGGMNHFMLPESDSGAWGNASASLRFGNFAMERLINDILMRGGRRGRLEVKIFGGASISGAGTEVGQRNVTFIESYLRAEGLPIAAADLGGVHARRVVYTAVTGRVRMLELRRVAPEIGLAEQGYAKRLRAEPPAGSIELFD